MGAIGLHVDDCLWVGVPSFKADFINKYEVRFKVGATKSKSFTFLGMNVNTIYNGQNKMERIEFDQDKYLDSISPPCYSGAGNPSEG